MRTISQVLADKVLEYLGYPSSLLRLVRARPDARVDIHELPASIDLQDVPSWSKLVAPSGFHWAGNSIGELSGWRYDGTRYLQGFTLHRPEYERLVDLEIDEKFSCDIQQVHGFAASRSSHHKFSSMEEMAMAASPELISEISRSALDNVLSGAALSPDSVATNDDFFVRHSWHGRLYVINGDGSHRFAAAKTIAGRLNIPVRLSAPLQTYRINAAAVESLERDFEMFVISDEPEFANEFHYAMERFKATYLWHMMPSPFENSRAILLPRSDSRARRVATILRGASFVDLGQYFRKFAQLK